mmetsp:Transcript_9122/g.14967  ORF Transcript_9122/g.14967 Transcript_9122/m.14967 type:complete len:544 (+) Transcript_9122:144-1775(+)|eukprot:CAMPEP_0184645160 /NCGR_PEP_ID=MMETSP0308-20130426/1692_1 /TAXON_ID=38269 /ORGANISM="Gloeochaete witrockiana, Strain SAG 46.84" /LENGTH=543 /DNA_ID=CAMNT_0027074009 /DNA_START=116 /DNA_END=1747 /DNA_ORIENTATION=+
MTPCDCTDPSFSKILGLDLFGFTPASPPAAPTLDAPHERVNATSFFGEQPPVFDPNDWIGSIWKALLHLLISQFLRNHFFSGGLLLGLFGVVIQAGNAQFQRCIAYFKSLSNTGWTVELEKDDRAFTWVLQWLSKREELAKVKTYSATTTYDEEEDEQGNVKSKANVQLLPLVDGQTINYNGIKVRIARAQCDKQRSGAENNGGATRSWNETLTVSSNSKQTIVDLLQEATDSAQVEKKGKIELWVSDRYGQWQYKRPRSKRPISSVVMDEGVAEDLMADMRKFLAAASWYSSMGIPYRRGYLLYGKPGCGKTSIVTALAGENNLPICVLNLSSSSMNDETLCQLLNDAHPSAVLLLEDIDAAFNKRSAVSNDDGTQLTGNLTFSGLLNALDGVASQEGRLVFMTTNHVSRLDPALIRPGRVDRKVEILPPGHSQLSRMFSRFFPEATKEQMNSFATSVPERVLSMAEVQSYLLMHRESMEEALVNVRELSSLASHYVAIANYPPEGSGPYPRLDLVSCSSPSPSPSSERSTSKDDGILTGEM